MVFITSLRSCALDESSFSIGRVNRLHFVIHLNGSGNITCLSVAESNTDSSNVTDLLTDFEFYGRNKNVLKSQFQQLNRSRSWNYSYPSQTTIWINNNIITYLTC